MHLKVNTGSVLCPVRDVDWFCGSRHLALNHMQTFIWALGSNCNFSSRVCLLKQVTYVSRSYSGLNTRHPRRGLQVCFDMRGYFGKVWMRKCKYANKPLNSVLKWRQSDVENILSKGGLLRVQPDKSTTDLECQEWK